MGKPLQTAEGLVLGAAVASRLGSYVWCPVLNASGPSKAYTRGLADLKIASKTLPQGDPLIPFAEALNWLYSLEEWHRKALTRRGVDYYLQ
jgi:hypothetical protein